MTAEDSLHEKQGRPRKQSTRFEIHDMLDHLRSQYEKVKADLAFLALKQSELHPDDEISFFGFLEAKQNLHMEQSLLSGHALMIQEDIRESRVILDQRNQQLLNDIITYSRRLWFS